MKHNKRMMKNIPTCFAASPSQQPSPRFPRCFSPRGGCTLSADGSPWHVAHTTHTRQPHDNAGTDAVTMTAVESSSWRIFRFPKFMTCATYNMAVMSEWHRSCSHGSNYLHFAQHWEPARIAQVLPNNKRSWLLHLRCKRTWILGYTGYTHYTYLPKVGEFRFSFSWEKKLFPQCVPMSAWPNDKTTYCDATQSPAHDFLAAKFQKILPLKFRVEAANLQFLDTFRSTFLCTPSPVPRNATESPAMFWIFLPQNDKFQALNFNC